MIVNKKIQSLKGQIEYIINFKQSFGFSHCDHEEEEFLEYEGFSNLSELLKKLSPEFLDEIKTQYHDVESIEIASVSFFGGSEDKKTSVNIRVCGKPEGYISTEINNNDIDNRLLTNIGKLKKIIDNTLEEYPIKF